MTFVANRLAEACDVLCAREHVNPIDVCNALDTADEAVDLILCCAALEFDLDDTFAVVRHVDLIEFLGTARAEHQSS